MLFHPRSYTFSIQVILLLPFLCPAWSFSPSSTPSFPKFSFDHTPQCLFRAHYLSYSSFPESDSALISLSHYYVLFCFALYSPRHLSEGDNSIFCYMLVVNPPHHAWLRAYFTLFLSSRHPTSTPIIAVM